MEEEKGIAKRPVKGLSTEQIADSQKKMIGFNNLIDPPYSPKLFIEEIDQKQVVVLWVPGGSSRPYEVPERITEAPTDPLKWRTLKMVRCFPNDTAIDGWETF